MERLVIVLIIFTSLGFKANGWHDTGMVYGFDNVSLGLCQPISSN